MTNKKIIFLTIDDDFISRKLISSILKKFPGGSEIIEAENGKEALEILKRRNDVDLILLDMNMPVLNGESFLINLPEDTFIPIIVMTTDEKYKSIALDSGAAEFMVKPINPETLISKIQEYVGN